MIIQLFFLFFVSATVGVHADYPIIPLLGVIPDTADLAQSALAVFMAFDGGHLYTTPRPHNGMPSVCGAEASSASSCIVLPVTLRELDRLHGTLSIHPSEQTSTESLAQLDMVEGCYLISEGKDVSCVVALQSNPDECGMKITDSTAYWAFRERLPLYSSSAEVLGGGADLFVENVLWIRDLRERLRRSIKRSQESTQDGKSLWSIVLPGWNANPIQRDREAFSEAVSLRGTSILKSAYADVMDKWTLVKKWMKTSVGEIEDDVKTFATKNGGKLLNQRSLCNTLLELDNWLAFFDPVYFGYTVAASVEQEISTLFSGIKGFPNQTVARLNRLGRIPCVATSFAVSMMLFEDFPLRLAYSDMMNDTEFNSNKWPLERFSMLGDVNETVKRNTEYMVNYYTVGLGYLAKQPDIENILDGNISLANCITQAILRTSGEDGSLPPSSVYECFSVKWNLSNEQIKENFNKNAKIAVAGVGEDMVNITVPPCPWGFVRPSGNTWNAKEECVMCPVGSFDDNNGGCRCSSASYPTDEGCKAKEDKDVEPPLLSWTRDPSEVFTANDNKDNVKPFLVVDPPKNFAANDKVVVEVRCTRGLTRFEVEMMLPDIINTSPSSPSSPPPPPSFSVQRVEIPLQRTITLVSTSTISLSLSSSAAFGGEQCDFDVWTKSLIYRNSPVVRAGSVVILPPISKVDVHASTSAAVPDFTSPSSSSVLPEPELPLCDRVPKGGDPATATLTFCTTSSGRRALLLTSQMYTPLTPSAFRILKEVIWVDGTQASVLGHAMQSVWSRVSLAVRIKEEHRNSIGSVSKPFIGYFPLSADISELILLPDAWEDVTVDVQVVDRCTARSMSIKYPDCVNAKLIFAPGALSQIVFKLPVKNVTEVPTLPPDEKPPPSSSWWKVTLIALGIVDAVLLTVTVTLFLVHLFYPHPRSSCEEVDENNASHSNEYVETESMDERETETASKATSVTTMVFPSSP